MKTTLEIPDELYRRAKATAALRGTTLTKLIAKALEAELEPGEKGKEPSWTPLFGALSHLHEENVRIQKFIDEEFGQIEEEMWK